MSDNWKAIAQRTPEETGLAGNGKTEQEAIDELIALQMVYDESNANTEASQ